jgi:hypothetical protein
VSSGSPLPSARIGPRELERSPAPQSMPLGSRVGGVPIKPSADDPDPGPLYCARHNARDPRPATLGATRRAGPNLAYDTAAHGIDKLAAATATVSPSVATPMAASTTPPGCSRRRA